MVGGRDLGAETEDDNPCDEWVKEGLVEDFDDEVEIEVFVPFLSGSGGEKTGCCCDFFHFLCCCYRLRWWRIW